MTDKIATNNIQIVIILNRYLSELCCDASIRQHRVFCYIAWNCDGLQQLVFYEDIRVLCTALLYYHVWYRVWCCVAPLGWSCRVVLCNTVWVRVCVSPEHHRQRHLSSLPPTAAFPSSSSLHHSFVFLCLPLSDSLFFVSPTPPHPSFSLSHSLPTPRMWMWVD